MTAPLRCREQCVMADRSFNTTQGGVIPSCGRAGRQHDPHFPPRRPSSWMPHVFHSSHRNKRHLGHIPGQQNSIQSTGTQSFLGTEVPEIKQQWSISDAGRWYRGFTERWNRTTCFYSKTKIPFSDYVLNSQPAKAYFNASKPLCGEFQCDQIASVRCFSDGTSKISNSSDETGDLNCLKETVMQHTAIVVFLIQSLGGTNVRNVKKKKKNM